MIKKVSLEEKFRLFSDHWKPRIVGEVNNTQIKLVRLLGEFQWHHHDNEDEMFLVLEGTLAIELEDGALKLEKGEMAVIPKGVEHRPVAEKEVLAMLVEPASTVNTGNAKSSRTTDAVWI